MLYWKLRDLIGCAIFASPSADFLEKIILTTPIDKINGRNSCTGNSRHINIRYFWVKDRVDNKEVRIEYIPTHLMLADYFTKPLQGEQFRIVGAYIMGWRQISELLIQKDIKKTDRIKEDVGKREKTR